MSGFVHLKYYYDSLGLDLETNDIQRDGRFLSGGQNAILDANGSFRTRPGWQRKIGSQNSSVNRGHLGIYKFDSVDLLGNRKKEIIGFGFTASNQGGIPTLPWRLKTATFTITNDHSGPLTFRLYADSSTETMRFKAFNGSTEVFDLNLTGIDVAAMKTSVDASSYLSMSSPTPNTADAEGVDFVDDVSIASAASHTFTYYYWEQVNVPTHASLSHSGYLTDDWSTDNFKNPSCVILNGVLYISGRATSRQTLTLNYLYKYDGQNIYAAGLPDGISGSFGSSIVAPSTAQTDSTGAYTLGGTGITGTYKYGFTFICVDKTGQVIESDFFENTNTRTPANQFVAITAPSPFHVNKLFNCGQAFVNGAQTSVTTITVDNGGMAGNHRLNIGDIAYFYSTSHSQYIAREITAITSTSITISTTAIESGDGGGAVTVRDNAIISNNIRAALWRTKDSGSSYFLVAEIPYGIYTTISTTNRFFDATSDNNLGAEYVPPPYPHTAPPAGRYLSKFNDKLIVAGDEFDPKKLSWSDETPEYFPGVNNIIAPEIITGHFECGDVLIYGTKNSIYGLSGDLTNFNIRIEQIANNIGIMSHHSIVSADEGVSFFLTDKGPYVLTGGRNLQPLGSTDGQNSRLLPYFTKFYDQSVEYPDFSRAIACVIKKQKLYILFIPWVLAASPRFATSNSVAFVFDYGKGAWLPQWTNIDMMAGIVDIDDDNIYYGGRTNRTYPSRIMRTNIASARLNYADHDEPIDMQLKYHWESLNEPSIFKKFLRILLASLGTRISSSMTIGVTTHVDYDENTVSTSDTFTMGSEKKSVPIKLKSDHAQSMRLTLSANTMHQETLISGYEYEINAPFKGVKK